MITGNIYALPTETVSPSQHHDSMTAMPNAPSVPDQPRIPGTADLDDPLYYLANFETVVRWVHQHHKDLLLDEECHLIDSLMALSPDARALAARMVMRTGEHFRMEKLRYSELAWPISELIGELEKSGWIDPAPEIHVPELFRLYTLAELRPALAEFVTELGLKISAPKGQLRAAMIDAFPDPAPVTRWLPDSHTHLVRLQHMALFQRLRLMFFGNLRQSWSDFVLVELGHQQFEQVPFTPDARAFDARAEVDRYLLLQQCRDRLDEGEPPAEIMEDIPDAGDNAWLESRRGRLLFELARQAERGGDIPLALEAYAQSRHRESRLRQLRLLERQKQYQQAWDIARQAADQPRNDAEVQGLKRLMSRLARKLDQPLPARKARPAIPAFTLTLDNPHSHSVEWRTLEHLHTPESPVAYVENTLINGLFGLLCWPAIFAPVPGAFFHPFHNGPVDLYREDFLNRRQALFEDCLAHLENGTYPEIIRRTWRQKYGIASPFVIWPVLTESLLDMTLACIPAEHLKVLFHRLMADLRIHRSGFPDLIRFEPSHPNPQRRYEMIEVKGPGDRLQDHQTRWLEYCVEQEIPVSVCYVRWQETPP
jgi:tetratricopeptide (TPR) repeat protein